jgi:hypothetical protein
MLTAWMHDGDPLWPLFLARIVVLAGAIGMAAAIGIGAVLAHRLAAAMPWFGRGTREGAGVSAA